MTAATGPVDYDDDDEETSALLVSKQLSGDELSNRIGSLVKRFIRDHAVYEGITAQELGCPLPRTGIPDLSEPPRMSIPDTFQSEQGRIHLEAIMALGKVSQESALVLTLRTLSTISTDRLDPLLGTRHFLLKILEFHHRQRLARLCVVAECLRLAQDQESPLRDSFMMTLSEVDGYCIDQSKKRGLLRFLLSATCPQDATFSREQLEKIAKLGTAIHCKQFLEDAQEIIRLFTRREQIEAMDAIMALLYGQIDQGVTRADLVLIMTAFQSQGQFFVRSQHLDKSLRRMSMLCALACVESMALWQSTDTSPDCAWVEKHPLLVHCPGPEMETIIKLVKTYTSVQRQGPEALIALALGLLLQSASIVDPQWSNVRDEAMNLVVTANHYDALGYLETIMNELIEYMPMEGDENTPHNQELSSRSLIYASVGRELVSAMVSNFHESILTPRHESFAKNVQMLCSLAAITTRNSPILSDIFWFYWNDTETVDRTIPTNPLVLLMDTANQLAVSAMMHELSDESFLLSITPLVRFVSAVIYHPEMVAPETQTLMFRDGLLCKALHVASRMANSSVLYEFIASVAVIATIADSPGSRATMRNALDGEIDSARPTGPRLLVDIVLNSTQGGVSEKGLEILSNLLQESPSWTLEISSILKSMKTSDQETWRRVMSQSDFSSRAAAKLLDQISRNISYLIFREDMSDSTACELINFAWNSITPLASMLSSLGGTSTQLLGKQRLSFDTARAIMDCISGALTAIEPVIALHPSQVVRQSGDEFRKVIVSLLAARVGISKAIMYYATVPALFGLASALDGSSRDDMVQTQKETSKYGLFHNLMTSVNEPSQEKIDVKLRLKLDQCLSDFDTSPFAFTEVLSGDLLGTEEATQSPLRAASSALVLLERWSRAVEGSTSGDTDASPFSYSSPYRLLSTVTGLPVLSRSLPSSPAWTALRIPYISLLARYVGWQANDHLQSTITIQATSFLVSSIIHGRMYFVDGVDPTDGLFTSIYESECLHVAMRKCIRYAVAMLGSKIESDERATLDVGLSCMRFLAECMDASPVVALKIMDTANDSTFLNMLISSCKKVAMIIQSGDFDQNITWTRDIHIGCACLGVVKSLWTAVDDGSQLGKKNSWLAKAQDVLECDESLIQLLLGVIPGCSATVTHEPTMSLSLLSTIFLRFSFARMAIETVSFELSPARGNIERNEAIARALEGVYEEDLSRFVALSKDLLVLSSLHSVALLYDKNFSSIRMAPKANPATLLNAFAKTSFTQYRSTDIELNPYDVLYGDAWLSNVRGGAPMPCSLEKLAINYRLLQSELSLARSFKVMASLVASLEAQKWRGNRPSLVLSLSMTQQVIRAIEVNLNSIDGEDSRCLFSQEIDQILRHLSCLPIHFFLPEVSFHVGHPDEWVSVLTLTTRCCHKIMEYPISSQDTFLCLMYLFSASLMLLARAPKDFSSNPSTTFLEIGEVVCRAINMVELEFEKAEYIEDASCLPVSVALLSTITTIEVSPTRLSPLKENAYYRNKLFPIYKDTDVVRSLIRLVSLFKARKSMNVSINIVCDLQQLILEFLCNVAVVGDAEPMKTIVREVAQILPKRSVVHIVSDSSASIRGRGSISGRHENSTHDFDIPGERSMHNAVYLVWLSSLKLVASALQSSVCLDDKNTTIAFMRLASDFMISNRASLQSCLQECSSHVTERKHPLLTLHLLREASLILSILKILSSDYAVESCARGFADLKELLSGLSQSLFPSISNFLGASGASRELFYSISEIVTVDTMSLDSEPQLALFGPTYFVLAGGIDNALHEAIRYSHFVSRCSKAVMKIDLDKSRQFTKKWQPYSSDVSVTSDPRSLESLKRKSREAVTNLFAFEMEQEAAQVLFLTLGIMWNLHPVRSSFTMISRDEGKALNAMEHIRPGTMIAYRKEDRSLIIPGFHDCSPCDDIEYAEVVACDTVNRQWHVARMENENCCSGTVSEWQLAGVENSEKRRASLLFQSAPQSAGDLENSSAVASIGHLILILRWCSQFYYEVEDEVTLPLGRSVAMRLAELAADFLAMEVIVRKEMGSQPSDEMSTVAAIVQLLDLFGEHQELNEILAGSGPLSSAQRGERLRVVMGDETWGRVRDQLRNELDRAIEFMKAKTYSRSQLLSRSNVFARR